MSTSFGYRAFRIRDDSLMETRGFKNSHAALLQGRQRLASQRRHVNTRWQSGQVLLYGPLVRRLVGMPGSVSYRLQTIQRDSASRSGQSRASVRLDAWPLLTAQPLVLYTHITAGEGRVDREARRRVTPHETPTARRPETTGRRCVYLAQRRYRPAPLDSIGWTVADQAVVAYQLVLRRQRRQRIVVKLSRRDELR
jgi:4-amino-4-deoxy-L-arabinose transferase-like glycosyltransferase